jgi:heterodisulfide reductase subunit A-like polyferredoxin/coenzyme F420-reducing hydrogenase delta subunit
MNSQARTGVFICECGQKIAPLVDLKLLEDRIGGQAGVAHCETVPYACLRPGLDRISGAIVKQKLNRLVIAGCEGRLMQSKFEKELEKLELRRGQIDMVNLRGHVAAVSDLSPQAKAEKTSKLIKASVAEMAALVPGTQTRVFIEGPVAIVGGGIGAYTAACELARRGVEFLLVPGRLEPEEVIRRLHGTYPGERPYYDRLRKIIKEVYQSPHATILPPSKLTGLNGVTGNYRLTFADPEGMNERRCEAGAIVACIDAEMQNPGARFGHDGQSVLIQPEMEEFIWQNGIPKGRLVFWVSDFESGQPEFAELSARSAWGTACHIRERSRKTEVLILFNEQMKIPLDARERRLNRQLGINWIPYDPAVRPSTQDGFVTFCSLADHLEHEVQWDKLVLSPVRRVSGEGLETARVLGLVHQEGHFLTGHHARVRPEMVGREESYLAGSARYPCDLHETLAQGRKTAVKTIEMLEKSKRGELFAPLVYCVVDPAKCIGCGQCQELCDCGGIGIAEGPGGGLPRVVDPMVCTGGGTCAAACPYHALVLQNNSTEQREARAAALASQLAADEVLAYGCSWAGLPAADNAGLKKMTYDPRVHLLGVPCLGQLDPCILARAFLEGSPGVILIGCMPEDCHHSYGIDHAWSRVNVIKKVLALCGFDRRRIAIAHADLNKPDEFVRTVDNFTRMIAALGPIEKTPLNLSKLQAMYDLLKYNTRVRHLISAGLRRPWEDAYRGDQRHALDYDRDFSAVLSEEFLQQRLLHLLREGGRPFKLQELAAEVHEDEVQVVEVLWDMVTTGRVEFRHKESETLYALNN